MGRPEETEMQLSLDAAAFDDWVRAVRLLLSHLGFALDNYLASRPPPDTDGN